jgi:Holliday junction resolvase
MTNGRQKGAAFEREVAKLIDEHLGVTVKRDLEQYRSSDRGDLIGLDGWTIECKRYAADRGTSGSFKPAWWEQAVSASLSSGTEPVLIYKYDRQPIRCVVFLSSINSDFAGKDNVATISFSTWCMLVREGLSENVFVADLCDSLIDAAKKI